MNRWTIAVMPLCAIVAVAGLTLAEERDMGQTESTNRPADAGNEELATFGGGCFWCIEAVFEQLQGVKRVESGYTGGKLKDPTYAQVCSGMTGHAEVVQIAYDPAVVSFDELLEVFWKTHDPTTLNRQGNDVGTQYRSAIFYHTDEQQRQAAASKARLAASGAFDDPIVTEITPIGDFYPAEEYHQDYYQRNPGQGYCSYVIRPKVEKFREAFSDKLQPAGE